MKKPIKPNKPEKLVYNFKYIKYSTFNSDESFTLADLLKDIPKDTDPSSIIFEHNCYTDYNRGYYGEDYGHGTGELKVYYKELIPNPKIISETSSYNKKLKAYKIKLEKYKKGWK